MESTNSSSFSLSASESKRGFLLRRVKSMSILVAMAKDLADGCTSVRLRQGAETLLRQGGVIAQVLKEYVDFCDCLVYGLLEGQANARNRTRLAFARDLKLVSAWMRE